MHRPSTNSRRLHRSRSPSVGSQGIPVTQSSVCIGPGALQLVTKAEVQCEFRSYVPSVIHIERPVNLQALRLSRYLSNALSLVDEASLILRKPEHEIRECEVRIRNQIRPSGRGGPVSSERECTASDVGLEVVV